MLQRTMPKKSTSSIRTFVIASLLAIAAPVWAQAAIEQQMTPEQFNAAGLNKLSAEELARLNAWLRGEVETQIAVVKAEAKVEAKKEVVEENRGFLSFGSSEPIVSRITGEFRGFGKGRSYTLENGLVWSQTDDASLSSVRMTNPEVKITPSIMGNAWYMAIEGYNTRAKVQRVK